MKLKVSGNLNPVTFVPKKENEIRCRDCTQWLAFNYAGVEDLMDNP